MKIVDASCLAGTVHAPAGHSWGVGRVWRGILEELARRNLPDVACVSPLFPAEAHEFWARNSQLSSLPVREPQLGFLERRVFHGLNFTDSQGGYRPDWWAKVQRHAWIRWNRGKYVRKAAWYRRELSEATLVLCESSAISVLKQVVPRARFQVLVHDLIPLTHPELCRPELTAAARENISRMVDMDCHYLTDSRFVRDEVIRVGKVSPERVTAIPLGLDAVFQPADPAEIGQALGERMLDPGVLYIGVSSGDVGRKGTDRAVLAVAELRKRGLPVRILVVGYPGEIAARLDQLLPTEVAWRDFVSFSGAVRDDEMPALLSACTVFLFLSLAEGFGYPPLEAMACGVPVVSSNRSSLPEVVGDAGILVDPDDHPAVVNALEGLVRSADRRSDMASRGLERARGFTWQRTVDTILETWSGMGE